MNPDNKTVQILIQGGAVGLALVSITFFFIFATRTVTKNTETSVLIIESNKQVVEAVKSQTSAILKVFTSNDVVFFPGLNDSALTTDLP